MRLQGRGLLLAQHKVVHSDEACSPAPSNCIDLHTAVLQAACNEDTWHNNKDTSRPLECLAQLLLQQTDVQTAFCSTKLCNTATFV